MRMRKLGIVLIVTFVLMLIFSFYMGIFRSVTVEVSVSGPYYAVFRNHTGDYSGIGKVIHSVKDDISGLNITPISGFGQYYDDPAHAPADKLRSRGGYLVEEIRDTALLDVLKKKGILYTVLPDRPYATVIFPYRNNFSMLIGIFKAYPALGEYAKQKKWPPYSFKDKGFENDFALEIYGPKEIRYLMTMPAGQ